MITTDVRKKKSGNGWLLVLALALVCIAALAYVNTAKPAFEFNLRPLAATAPAASQPAPAKAQDVLATISATRVESETYAFKQGYDAGRREPHLDAYRQIKAGYMTLGLTHFIVTFDEEMTETMTREQLINLATYRRGYTKGLAEALDTKVRFIEYEQCYRYQGCSITVYWN